MSFHSLITPLHYILFGCAVLISLIPLTLLYALSYLIYFILNYIIRYRRKIILNNLKKSFPEYSHQKIDLLIHEYYRHLSRLVVEMIKMLTISKHEVLKRYHIINPDILTPYYKQQKSVILASAHYNNWEWMILSMCLQLQHYCIGVGKPNSNKSFEHLINKHRTRFGTIVIFMNQLKSYLDNYTLDKPAALMMLADQNPSNSKKSYIVPFLNQNTHFLYGPEYIAKRYNIPVFYYTVHQTKIGFYEITLKLITEHPQQTPYGYITETYVHHLETSIRENPTYWLWSHKRWKHAHLINSNNMFTVKEINHLNALKKDVKQVEKMFAYFKSGFPFAQLNRAATVNDGIIQFSTDDIHNADIDYANLCQNLKFLKFVPASGAASRMFKDLFQFLEDGSNKNGLFFTENITKTALFKSLKMQIENQGLKIEEVLKNPKQLIHFVLDKENGLNYAEYPKGVILFHKYTDKSRTAFEEHLVEGALYAKNQNGNVYLHFTVSPQHLTLFQNLLNKVQKEYEKEYQVSYHIDFSIQKPATDTLSATAENTPFTEKDGNLLFRPGGHGALIQNLNDIDADIVYIKNIDNVVPDKLKPETVRYKKLLATLLIKTQQECFRYLRLSEDSTNEELIIEKMKDFALNALNLILPENFQELSIDKQKIYLRHKLNRPIRVCGMVKNVGEPGGGPFWVTSKGNTSLQIVESSQINMNDEEQKNIFKNATHFNPVDLVCGIKNYKGEKFDLTQYINPDTGFISEKSKDGKILKAMELPGLWNGAMADWNTIFAEVPLITFNPVKTINDLLRPEHLSI